MHSVSDPLATLHLTNGLLALGTKQVVFDITYCYRLDLLQGSKPIFSGTRNE